MYELKNEYYHHKPYFIIIVFLEFIFMFFLALFLCFNIPLVEILYIGEWYESALNQIQYTNLTTKITVLFIFNVIIYWSALIIPLALCTDFFFKHFIGYELSLRESVKIVGEKALNFVLKYVILLAFTILIAVICKPLYEMYLRLMDSNTNVLFPLILPIAYIFGCYVLTQILIDIISSKLFIRGKLNKLH